jgi:hypothetical protein
MKAMEPNVPLKKLVADVLASRGLPGTVEIYPNKPLALRQELGERVKFIVDYHGVGDARIVVDEWEISCGTVGARVEDALADQLERAMERRLAS